MPNLNQIKLWKPMPPWQLKKNQGSIITYIILWISAKRELFGAHLYKLDKPISEMSETLRTTLRFPIYVHSKMMIVDDVYIIVGSANINQRSMGGNSYTFYTLKS